MKRTQKIIGLMVISFCLCGWFIQEGQARNIYNLKGTLSVLPPVLQELSVLHGAIAFETGMVRRLYDFGMFVAYPGDKPVEPIKPADDNLTANKKFLRVLGQYELHLRDYEKRLETHKKALQNCAPAVKLTRYFFYRIPGSTTIVDFQLSSTKFNEVTPSDFAEKIGQLVAVMWWYEWMLKQEITSPDNVKGALNKDVRILVEKDSWLSGFSQPLIEGSLDDKEWGNRIPMLIILAALWVKCGHDKAVLQKYNEVLIDALKGKIKKFMRIEEMQYLGDRKEAYITTIREKFGHNEVALNAKLEKLAVCERIQPEAIALQSTLEAFRIPDSWGDVFTPIDGKRKLSIEDLTSDNDLAVANYEQLVFQYCFSNVKPMDIGHGQVALVDVDGKTIPGFPDCMESVIRNFTNHLAYDSDSKIFSIDHLKKVTGKENQSSEALKSLNAELERFYTEYRDPNYVTQQNVRDAWIKITSNIPWGMYECRYSDKRSLVRMPNDISEENRIRCREFYGEKYGYRVVDHDNEHVLYELTPNCRNFIMVVDYLLHLGLFEHKDIATEFLRDDFIKEYLPKIFKVMHGFELKKNEEQVALKDFDRNDSSKGMASIFKVRKIEAPAYDMIFDISIGRHGGFGSLAACLATQEGVHISSEQLKLLPYTLPMLLTDEEYKKIFSGDHQDLCTFWAHEGDNPDKVIELVSVEELKIHSELLLKTLLFFVGRANDLNRRMNGRLLIYRAAVDGGIASCSQDALQNVQESWFSGVDSGLQSLVLNLFKALFNKNLGFDVAISVATSALKNIRSFWYFGEDLFEELLKRGKGFKEVIELATGSSADRDNSLTKNETSLMLFRLLVKYDDALDDEDKNKVYKAAINAAENGMMDSMTNELSLMVFIELVNKNQGFKEAIHIAKKGMEKMSLKKLALTLFAKLVDKDQGIKDATTAVFEELPRERSLYADPFVRNNESEIRKEVLNLFEVLCKSCKGFDEVRKQLQRLPHPEREFYDEIKEIFKRFKDKRKDKKASGQDSIFNYTFEQYTS